MKNRLRDPSKICALEFKEEFRRFGICSVSATIDDDRPISAVRRFTPCGASREKNTVSLASTNL
jgi:hypothetical protein